MQRLRYELQCATRRRGCYLFLYPFSIWTCRVFLNAVGIAELEFLLIPKPLQKRLVWEHHHNEFHNTVPPPLYKLGREALKVVVIICVPQNRPH